MYGTIYRELKNHEARFADAFQRKKRQKFVSYPKIPGTNSPDLDMTIRGIWNWVSVWREGQCAKTYPTSSFWSLARGFAEEAATGVMELATLFTPPPPRKGFAIRPKFRGNDADALAAEKKQIFGHRSDRSSKNLPRAWSNRSLTACNCDSNFWFWTESRRSASCRRASRFCIRSFRARSFRSAIPASFFNAEFWSTN